MSHYTETACMKNVYLNSINWLKKKSSLVYSNCICTGMLPSYFSACSSRNGFPLVCNMCKTSSRLSQDHQGNHFWNRFKQDKTFISPSNKRKKKKKTLSFARVKWSSGSTSLLSLRSSCLIILWMLEDFPVWALFALAGVLHSKRDCRNTSPWLISI